MLSRADLTRQMAQADAQLNGAKPEFYRFVPVADLQQHGTVAVQEALVQQRQLGAQHQRIVQTPDGIWIEGWRERPRFEAPFDPPMTLEPVK